MPCAKNRPGGAITTSENLARSPHQCSSVVLTHESVSSSACEYTGLNADPIPEAVEIAICKPLTED